ncbi:MAG: hypothetical protein HFH10_11855 [Dorea sp.]|jgi:hypothetical protein|nr:hypothetical protein [Dorea sp.]MCI9270696.1 hypothetical protein [Dorea sp.]
MQQDSVLAYAGDLSMELEEIEKLIPDEEQIENAYTKSLMCGASFTIICC